LAVPVPPGEKSMKTQLYLGLVLLALGSCGPKHQPGQPTHNANAPILSAPSAPPGVENSEAPAIPPPGTGPDARTPLAEPQGATDSKSAQAARQVVEHYGALIEQKRWDEALTLWGNHDAAAEFAAPLKTNRENHLEVGPLGRTEGAAGSIYIIITFTLYGEDIAGKKFQAPGAMILRRVNDVAGSTEAQRHWHIERIDWGKAA